MHCCPFFPPLDNSLLGSVALCIQQRLKALQTPGRFCLWTCPYYYLKIIFTSLLCWIVFPGFQVLFLDFPPHFTVAHHLIYFREKKSWWVKLLGTCEAEVYFTSTFDLKFFLVQNFRVEIVSMKNVVAICSFLQFPVLLLKILMPT